MNEIRRFLNNIRVTNDGCWEWAAFIRPDGYCVMRVNGKKTLSHRFIYEYYYNEISPNLTIHHICYNRKCVNPIHLKQISLRDNILDGNNLAARNARKTHCKHGHKFTKENTYLYPDGRRLCRICNIKNTKTYWARVAQTMDTNS